MSDETELTQLRQWRDSLKVNAHIQGEDSLLWAEPTTPLEAYLQSQLRQLHDRVTAIPDPIPEPTGKWVKRVHRCVLPPENEGAVGSIWECECGVKWELRWALMVGERWYRLDTVEAAQ